MCPYYLEIASLRRAKCVFFASDELLYVCLTVCLFRSLFCFGFLFFTLGLSYRAVVVLIVVTAVVIVAFVFLLSLAYFASGVY